MRAIVKRQPLSTGVSTDGINAVSEHTAWRTLLGSVSDVKGRHRKAGGDGEEPPRAPKQVPENRPRHTAPEIEAILTLAEAHKWRIMKGRKYYKGYCPCNRHIKTIHLSPSDPNYVINLRKWFERQPCWEEQL